MSSNNVLPDQLYLQSRESLLLYEDARMNSLIQSVANFYMTRNDQSTWGNVLRAIAEELSRLEYYYAYDLVNKIPQYLTPPDIKRRWADPCYVNANWPSPTQFDTTFRTMIVDLIKAYRLGSTAVSIQDVILAYTGLNIKVEQLYQFEGDGFYDVSDGNAIKVSVNVGGTDPLTDITSLNQLQAITQSLYGAIDLAKPAHVGLEFTTVFGTNENLDCLLSPTYLTEQMYISLAASDSTMQDYYTLNAYVVINPASFWQKNQPYYNTNASNGLGLLVVDANGNLQLVTALVSPYLSGGSVPTWNETSGLTTTDNNVTWTNISPSVTHGSVVNNVLTVTVANTLLPSSAVTATAVNNGVLTVTCANSFIRGQSVTLYGTAESYLNGQTFTVATASATKFTTNPLFVIANYTNVSDTGTAIVPQTVKFINLGNALFLNGQRVSVVSATSTQFTANFTDTSLVSNVGVSGGTLTVTCPNNFQPGMTIGFSGLLGATFLNGHTVIVTTANSTQFVVTGTAYGDYGPTADSGTAALIDYPSAAETQGTASYLPATPIAISQYGALSSRFKSLYQQQYLNSNCTGTGINDTLRIIFQGIEEPPFQQMLIQAPVLNPANPMTTIGAWGQKLYPTLSPSSWSQLPEINFTVTHTVSDGSNATYTYSSLNNSPGALTPPVLQLHEGELVVISGCANANLNGTARIKDVTATSFKIPNSATPSAAHTEGGATGVVGPTLASAYELSFGQYQLLQAPPATGVSTAYPPYLGVVPAFTIPIYWVAIVVANSSTIQTGELAGWDQAHPAGLLAPRLDQVWEVSGGDQHYLFGLT